MRGPRPLRLCLMVTLVRTSLSQSFWFVQAWQVINAVTWPGPRALLQGLVVVAALVVLAVALDLLRVHVLPRRAFGSWGRALVRLWLIASCCSFLAVTAVENLECFSQQRRDRILPHAHLPRHPCGDVLRRHRNEYTRLRFPACYISVHLVSRPVARNDAAGLVPDVLVVASCCARNDDIIRGDGWIVNAHGDVIVSLQVEVFQPICAGDKRQHLAVIAVPMRSEMRMAMPVNGRHHRNVRRSEIVRDLLLIHCGSSWLLWSSPGMRADRVSCFVIRASSVATVTGRCALTHGSWASFLDLVT